MSDTVKWAGGKLGPYHVGKRFRNTGTADRLYAGYRVETGAPALLMIPDRLDDWNQRLDWTVRITGREAPPFLALEVEGAPPFDDMALQELSLMVHRLGGGLSLLEDRPDAREHLTRQSVPLKKKGRARRGERTGAAAITAAVLLLSLWSQRAETPERPIQVQVAQQAPLRDAATYSDMEDNPVPVIGYAMPEKPLEEQKRPPCIPVTEVEIRGGCWAQHKRDAPCPPSTAEYEGHCYIPSKRKTPKPNSLQPHE